MDDESLSMARRRERVAEDIAGAKSQLKADLTVVFPKSLTTMSVPPLCSTCSPAFPVLRLFWKPLMRILTAQKGCVLPLSS
ncbi:MAG: hypothetical protein PF495_15090 [Spirochaetales bacterium]|nr:hypothetical protein [Spirochaetales bacterium]